MPIFAKIITAFLLMGLAGSALAEAPVAQLSISPNPAITTIAVGETVTFDATASTGDTSLDYLFYFGNVDGQWRNNTNGSGIATFSYPSEGTYYAQVVVTDANGLATESAWQQILVVGNGLKASLSVSTLTPALYEPVSFDATASAGDTPLTYLFYFGRVFPEFPGEEWASTTNTTGVADYFYWRDGGVFYVCVEVTDQNGASARSPWQRIVATSKIEISWTHTPQDPMINQPVTFDASATTGDGPFTYYIYPGLLTEDFSTHIREVNNTGIATFQYPAPGVYEAWVSVRDRWGDLKSSEIVEITVTESSEAELLQDTFVHKNKPEANFGNSSLRVAQHGIWISYLEFDISNFSGTHEALLSLRCMRDGEGVIGVYYNDSESWNELEMNYNNRISHSDAQKVGESNGPWVEEPYYAPTSIDIPLSSLPLDSDTITLILEMKGNGKHTQFRSSEETWHGYHPKLQIFQIVGDG